MVQLLLENWFEPPRTGGLHLSTLVQTIYRVLPKLEELQLGNSMGYFVPQIRLFQG